MLLGTMTWVRWKVSISVARMLMRRTKPSWPATITQSPALIGRSTSRMTPEITLLAMFCRPRPMPTESAPSTIARLVKSTPSAAMPITSASRTPI